MRKDCRTFLKATGAIALATTARTASAQSTPAAQSRTSADQVHPRGLTYATIRSRDGYGLGIRIDKGVLDVKAADAALKTGAPLRYYVGARAESMA